MAFMIWAAYRQAANKSVPAPWDTDTPDAPVWYDHVARQAQTWARLGITSVLLPPPLKTNAGHFPGADGYGTFDDYDIGSKLQFYSYETRFGTAEQLLRCIAVCRAAGLDVYVDIVPHQRAGGRAGVYAYLGADEKTLNGRFPKVPGYFRGDPDAGRVPEDPVPVPGDDFSFGDELCPINAVPAGAVMDGLLAAGDWLFRRLGVQGCRLDDTKGMATHFVRRWASHGAMAGARVIGEYADGNPDNLNAWVWDGETEGYTLPGGGTEGRCSAFDFSTHYPVQSMCNNNSNWGMWGLRGSLADRSSMNAVPFVESPDTDTDGFATVVWNKAMGYHWIACRTGAPSLYYKDWSEDAGCYGAGGLRPHIENSVWIQNKLAHGAQVERHAEFQTFAIERLGQPGLLCAMNNDQWNQHTITVQTAFGAGVGVHDYTGHAPDLWTDGQGRLTITLPRNVNGLGTVAYSRHGVPGEIAVIPKATTQTFFGAADLDIPPLPADGTLAIGRVWAAAGTPLVAAFTPVEAWWGNNVEIIVSVLDPAGAVLTAGSYDDQGEATQDVRVSKIVTTGWHTLRAVTTGLPAAGSAFQLRVTYTGGAF